jgi:hypothetical protein
MTRRAFFLSIDLNGMPGKEACKHLSHCSWIHDLEQMAFDRQER